MTVTAKTIYERIQYIYSRNQKSFLSLRTQKTGNISETELWECMQNAGDSDEDAVYGNMSVKTISGRLVFECDNNQTISGLVTEAFEPSKFDLWFMKTVLQNGAIVFPRASLSEQVNNLSLGSATVAETIAEIFESTIKHSARVDKWNEGRSKFIQNVEFFTMRGLPVEAVLPAFPCKSSNIHKVASATPDKGEELALERIVEFVQAVGNVYPPGMKFFIVSDGHVFSDCINVDDDVVDEYTNNLKKMYERVKPKGFDRILFRGLNDCFASSTKSFVEPMLLEVTIDHYLDTKLDSETETNRKILMVGCDDNADTLREEINTPQHPRLFLYRGFNKFMLDDLTQYQAAKKLSGKKYKKLVSQVAFEMIRRNDAYSNLVELMFPFHLRLSIHAHPNCGPKYGIRLLDPTRCAPQNHNQDVEDRLLHIPTPWHNAIYRVEGKAKMVVGASSLALEYDQSEEYSGGWHAEDGCFVYARTN